MPEFAYIARDLNGQDVSGQLKAPSERDATSILAERSLFVLKIEDMEAKA
ncbi:MAG: hypothetical protein R3C28_30255 [Pirellulaceae bacterium]